MNSKKKLIIFLIIAVFVVVLIVCLSVACVNDSKNEKLFVAIENNDIEMAEKAIAEGANVNGYRHTFSLLPWLGESTNPTPLWQACYCSNIDMVKMLVENGADVTKMEKISKTTPFGATFRTVGKDDRFEIALYLIDIGASLENEQLLIEGALEGPIGNETNGQEAMELLNRLIEKGVNLNDVREKNALTYATRCENIEAVRLLLENNYCQVNSRNNNEATALIVAADYGYIELAKELLNAGADASLKDSQGKSALDYATEDENNELVALLGSESKRR